MVSGVQPRSLEMIRMIAAAGGHGDQGRSGQVQPGYLRPLEPGPAQEHDRQGRTKGGCMGDAQGKRRAQRVAQDGLHGTSGNSQAGSGHTGGQDLR
jgi:hypothetical protein